MLEGTNNINWFPGHMAKAVRLIKENLKLVDLVVYVLDSRAVLSCLNPVFDELFSDKKIIYALNKADLVPLSEVNAWTVKLSTSKSTAVAIDSTTSKSSKIIVTKAKELCGNKLTKYSNKGVKATVRALVAGVPNCGKSTLINNLCGSGKTVTGNKPGVTKGKQWVRVNEYFEVLDTPGTLYPKLSNQTIAKRLAYIGSIRDEVTDLYGLSCSLLEELRQNYSPLLKERYKTEIEGSENELFEKFALLRGYLLKGGAPDVERMATAFIDDFRKGRMGKIMLERAVENVDC